MQSTLLIYMRVLGMFSVLSVLSDHLFTRTVSKTNAIRYRMARPTKTNIQAFELSDKQLLFFIVDHF